jgi:hypothetical protein
LSGFYFVQKILNKSSRKPKISQKTKILPHREVSLGKPADCHCGTGDKQKQRPFMDRAQPIGKR